MIYCIKIRQRKLPKTLKIDYFPYDRLYLIPKEDRKMADRMFQYFFYMDLSDDILKALIAYHYAHLRLIPALGRPTTVRGVTSELTPIWRQLTADNFVLIVPTYPQCTRSKTRSKTKPGAEDSPVVPAYYMSQALRANYNQDRIFPQIGIHTPNRDVPLLCAICKNYLGYSENECSPGRKSCNDKIEIPISLTGAVA